MRMRGSFINRPQIRVFCGLYAARTARMVSHGGTTLLFSLLLLQTDLFLAQFQGCPIAILNDTEGLAHLVKDALTETTDGQITTHSPPSIAILKSHSVCLSVGAEIDTISSMSLLIEYNCTGNVQADCTPLEMETDVSSFVVLEQFDFGCIPVGDTYAWTTSQFGKKGFRVPTTASFSTPLRRDCSACIGEGVADDIGIGNMLHLDSVSRCLACSEGCADVGMGLCFGLGTTMCCNYHLNGSCVNLCPNTTQPDFEYNCQRVVVGFEEKVYMAVEGEALLVIPVVVKEGQLTERVVLYVTTEDRTTTVGEDYHMANRRVDLIPGVNEDSGQVKVKIVNDYLPEDDEELFVKLELGSGSSAAIDIDNTVVVIIGDLDEEPPSDDSTVNATIMVTTPIESGCDPEIDKVWHLNWPNTAQESKATVSCGQDRIGVATRKCLSGAEWAAANVSLCQNRLIAEIGKMAEELFSQHDVQPADALIVVRELSDAVTSSSAASDTSQLPRDLATASNIITKTVNLLLQSTSDDSTSVNMTKINVNETAVVADVLSLILTDQNQNGFSSLHEQDSDKDRTRTTVGSSAVLHSAENYGQYISQTLVGDGDIEEPLLFSRENLVLLSEKRDTDIVLPGMDVMFPRMNELHDIVVAEEPPATVTTPATLLRRHFEGNVSVTNLFFRDLHKLLPIVFKNGTVPRSFVISSQIHGRETQQPNPFSFEDTPVSLTFKLELNDTDILPRCAFWDFSEGIEGSGWSTAGVSTVAVIREGNTVTVMCTSSHLTSFAVLVDVGGAQIDHKPLKVVSYIGVSISLLCLFLTIVFFASFGKKMLLKVHNFIHLNLSLSLFVAYFIFAVGIEGATNNSAACKAVTALIQYFLLAAFCWMMCEGIMLYLMLVVVFSKLSKKWWLFFILGWGTPLIFVIIGLLSVSDEYEVRDNNGDILYCWLASGSGRYAIWTFVAPVLAIIVVNSVFLVLVLRSIYISKSGQESKYKDSHSLVGYIVKASLILLPLLGLTWLFGLFAVNKNTAVFAWLFTILNSLQGVSIFLLHVLRNDRVWGRLRKAMTDPDSFLRSLSMKTMKSSIGTDSSRFSKRYEGGVADMEMSLKVRTADSEVRTSTAIESHSAEGLESIFEPREDTKSIPTVTSRATNRTTCENPATKTCSWDADGTTCETTMRTNETTNEPTTTVSTTTSKVSDSKEVINGTTSKTTPAGNNGGETTMTRATCTNGTTTAVENTSASISRGNITEPPGGIITTEIIGGSNSGLADDCELHVDGNTDLKCEENT